MKDNAPLSVEDLLETENLGRPRLVVLSACETGLHEIDRMPDEFVGLPGAFMTIGAAGVVATLWPVDDRAAALLIGKFYDLHLGERVAPSSALRRAQQWLRAATYDELSTYVKSAGTSGRLSSEHVARLQGSLDGTDLETVQWRFFSGQEVDASGIEEGAEHVEQTGVTKRPFAHPVFWGGFIYTGV